MADMKHFVMGGLLVLTSILISTVLIELPIRLLLFSSMPFMATYRDPGLYAPEYSDDYWKLSYWFTPRTDFPPAVHPLFAWTGHFEGEHYQHEEVNRLNGRRPVLLYRDSFAQCVPSNQDCYQQFLNTDREFTENHYFLNYGVGGYGLD